METIITLLRYVLLYFIIISGSIFIADKANKKIEKCIAPNIAITILILYLFGIFELLIYGVWVVSVINILLGLYTIIKNIKKIRELKEKVITPGFTFFTILFFILMLTTFNKNLVDYDHYLYRSLNTKIMYYTDCISKGFQSLYPPSINLLEYFFMKIIGVYLQGIEAFAVQLFGFSLLIPFFDRIKNTKFINTIITIIIICVPAIFGNLIFYEAAYPDALLGLLIGYSMYMLCTEESNKFKLFSVILALAIMTITKPAGFYISGIIIGMYLLVSVLNNKGKIKERVLKFLKSQELKNIIIITVAVIMIFISWKIFSKINNQYNQWETRPEQSRTEGNSIEYVLKNIMMTTFGYYEENHDSADSNNSLIPKIYSLYAVMSPVRMTIYGAIVAIMISALVVYKYVIKQENKKKYANYIITLTVGLAIYIVFLQLSYILKFSTQEMLGHNGLNRYMPTFLLGIIYFIVAKAIKNMEEKNDRKINYIILIAIIIACTPLQSIANISFTSGINNIQSIEYCNNGRIPANKIDEKIEDNEKVIIVSRQEDTDLYSLMLRYYLYPNHESHVYINTDNSIRNLKKKIINENISYIYLFSTDEKVSNLIENETILKNETLYKVHIENDKLELKEIPLD